jgi:hypothetical protein
MSKETFLTVSFVVALILFAVVFVGLVVWLSF